MTAFIKRFVNLLLLSLCWLGSQAQVSIIDSSVHLTTINIAFRGLVPGGDMADRFGFTTSLGVEVGHKFPSNIYVQGGFSLLFGGKVLEDTILRNISQGGFVINDNGVLSPFRLEQAGFIIPLSVGKVFPIIGSHNPNSGLYVELGGQYIQHKINIVPTERPVAALSKQSRRGYDRLTGGFGLRQGIGYKFFSNNGLINISVGLDFSQNFTQNQRRVNVDTGLRDDHKRVDLLSGFSVSWMLLLYKKAASSFYYR